MTASPSVTRRVQYIQRMRKTTVLLAALALAVAGCANAVDGTPVAGPDTGTSVSEDATTTQTTTQASEPPAAGDPGLLGLTCGEFMGMGVDEQKSAAHDLAVLLDRPLAAANENNYLLITAFCAGEPDTLVKDTLPLA